MRDCASCCEERYHLPMNDEVPFVPRGAVAFFGALILFYAAIWLLLMSIMVGRG